MARLAVDNGRPADYVTIFGSTFAFFDTFPDLAGAVGEAGASLTDIVAPSM